MAKGTAIKRDIIKSGDNKKPEETDTLSAPDQGHDFVKANETPRNNKGQSSGN
jgi:hypothetical protein